ncbi:MAG: hypothetical protein HYY55_01535 [Candidatus Niyogibacteria bacterium]|nr:MAG: hypothetical protein HYY55_01535 [Candidatus Niyogibacteria bacterium]
MFGFSKLSEAQKHGSASFLCRAGIEADFAPRAQADFARWGKERPV